MIRTSEETADLFAAQAAFLAACPVALKTATGQVGQQKTAYADLAAIKEAITGPMEANGLGYFQFPAQCAPGFVRIITRIVHKSGQWIEDEDGFTVPAGNTAQSVGSATTYGKRYALCAALGVVADADDDGAAASQQTQRRTSQRSVRTAAGPVQASTDPNMASQSQINLLAIECKKHGVEEENRVEFVARLVGRPIKSTTELTKGEISEAIDKLKRDAA